MKNIMNQFYGLPLGKVTGMIIIAILLWAGTERLTDSSRKAKKCWRYMNQALCVVAVLLIVRMTLWGRTAGQRTFAWMPFHTLATLSYNDEAIRTLLMNVVLFLPFGLTLPYVLAKVEADYRRWFYCILIGCMVSIGIELLQYCFALGQAETDDVLCNTFGCALGVMADKIGRVKSERMKPKEGEG